MKVKFSKPVSFDGKNYPVGEHKLADHLAGHWFFLSLIANKKAMVLEKPKGLAAESLAPLKVAEAKVAAQDKADAKKKSDALAEMKPNLIKTKKSSKKEQAEKGA